MPEEQPPALVQPPLDADSGVSRPAHPLGGASQVSLSTPLSVSPRCITSPAAASQLPALLVEPGGGRGHGQAPPHPLESALMGEMAARTGPQATRKPLASPPTWPHAAVGG